jgi:hypothetical protein
MTPGGAIIRPMADFTAQSIERTKLALKAAGLKLAVATPAAERSGAEIVAAEMRSRAPVDTGRLRGSIRPDGSSAIAAAPYAVYVDPFAAAAADAAMPRVEAAMIAVFRTALGGK